MNQKILNIPRFSTDIFMADIARRFRAGQKIA